MYKKKSLGQNFLNSPKIISDIVASGEVKKENVILEIGPGEGVLTSSLLQTGASIICVEKDQRLIPILQEKFSKEISSGQLNLIHADILELNISDLVKGDYKIIANIPYYITGQIIRMFLSSNNQPTSMTLLLQKEVADRIVARDEKESLLSLSVKIFGEPKIVRSVGKGAFSPPPKVDSAVLNIKNIGKSKLSGLDEEFFFKIIHAGFAHKRKQLMANLSLFYKKEDLIKIFEKIQIDPKIRAEDLKVEIWIKLCEELKTIIK